MGMGEAACVRSIAMMEDHKNGVMVVLSVRSTTGSGGCLVIVGACISLPIATKHANRRSCERK